MSTSQQPPRAPSQGRGRVGGRNKGGRGGRGGVNPVGGPGEPPGQPQSSSTAPRGDSAPGKGRGKGARNSNRGGKHHKKDTPNLPWPSVEELARQEEDKKRQQLELEEQRRKEADERAAKAAEEAKRKKREERIQEVLEAKDVLKSFIATARRHKESRLALSEHSVAAARKDFQDNKKSLKTDLKKCTAFVKKVKTGSAWSTKAADMTKELAALNLSRYVEEVAAAVVESKPKVADLPLVVALCSAMHQRYPDFLPSLVPPLSDIVTRKADGEMAKSRRIYLRLWTDFLLSGLITETKTILKCVVDATGAKDESYTVQDGNLVVAFAKAAGFEILGTTPKSIREAKQLLQSSKEQVEVEDLPVDLVDEGVALAQQVEDVVQERVFDPETREQLTKHTRGAYAFLATSLVQTHGKLQKLEKRCEQDRLMSGTLNEAREKGLLDARRLKDNLEKSVEALADVLDEQQPQLVDEDKDPDQVYGRGVEVWTKSGGEADFGPFDDEETRAFYCDIPDLLTTVPPVLLGLTPDQIERRKDENKRKYGADADEEGDVGDDTAEVVVATEAELEAVETEATTEVMHAGEEGKEADKDAPRYRLTALLEEELPECHRREQTDQLCEKFCTNHGSSKTARKRLSRALFLVPRNRFDLLPFYARVAATLDRVWSDIAEPLVTELEQQFHGQAKYKKNQNLDARLKTSRYVGELTKMRVAPPIVFLRCLRRCVEDFTSTNVDVACTLLESSGRFLFRLKHTNQKIVDIMEIMTRLSKAKNLDERSQSLIKAAFYNVNPPPSGPRQAPKEYPPLETYLRRLLIDRIVPTNNFISFASKQIVRLPWSDPSQECGALVTRIMTKACRKGRYKTIRAIAMIAGRLRTQRDAGEVTVRLIDSVLEELRWALEYPNFRDQQRVITYTRLLGELYDASQISGQLILHQLYDFINLGHEIPEALRVASKQISSSGHPEGDEKREELPVYNSATGISQTIQEDEELDDDALETRKEKTVVDTRPVAVSEHSKYDPRVPSAADPPGSAYRIKLVCTLLEVAAKSLVTKNNIPRLKGFLAAFQRYLFTKTMLPTDVEFVLLDTFDLVDSRWRDVVKTKKHDDGCFPRYATWLDAHNATVAVEVSEAVFEAARKEHPESITGEDKSFGDLDDQSEGTASVFDEEGSQNTASAKDSVTEGHEEDADTAVEEQQFETVDTYTSEDEDDADDSGGESSDYSEDEEEFDEEAYMKQIEEEAFERELRQLTMDALEKGKNTSRKLVADYMPAGSQIIKKKNDSTPAEAMSAPAPAVALGGKDGVTFQLLRKGNKGKVDAREIVVPKGTNLANAASRQDGEAARERDVIKQRVLQYEVESAYADDAGGNVYLQQEKLRVIRNHPLSLEDIDRNFGKSSGNLRPGTDNRSNQSQQSQSAGRRPGPVPGRGSSGGRGRGRSSFSGRTLFG